jgi:hypothetical protein
MRAYPEWFGLEEGSEVDDFGLGDFGLDNFDLSGR